MNDLDGGGRKDAESKLTMVNGDEGLDEGSGGGGEGGGE